MSDVNARIQLELVDGAAQKALADFIKNSGAADKAMSGLSKTTDKTKASTEKTSLSLSAMAKIITDDIGSAGSSSMGSFASVLSGPVALAIGSVISAGYALKKVFDLTLVSERNQQIANSFNAIAESAGLAGDKVRAGLAAAAQGLADDDDLMAAANKSIIELGDNAERIPEIMEIARKASALFGGDLIQNFENISQAIASGNVKSLRNLGIIIDTEAAQKKYAESLGISISQLSEVGKRQAIANEALAKAQEKFANVDESSAKATKAFKRMGVAGGELYDSIADLVSQSSLLSTVFDAVAKGLNTVTPPKSIAEEYRLEIQKLEVSLSATGKEIANYKAQLDSGNTQMNASTGLLKTRIEALEKQREAYQKTIEIRKAYFSSLNDEALKNRQLKDSEKNKTNDSINYEAVLKARTESAKAVAEAELSIARETAASQLAIIEERLAAQEITETEAIAMRSEIESQRRLAEQDQAASQFMLENENLKLSFENKLLAESDYFARRDALANKFAADTLKRQNEEVLNRKKINDQLEALEKRRMADTKSTLSTISTLTQSNSRELFALGKAAAIANATINTFEGVSKAWALGPILGPPLAALVAAAGAMQIANIASTNPSFATGGIVPGNSYTGDRVQANVNSGEMILNRQQQANLFNQIKSGGGDSSRMESLLGAIYSAIESQPIVVNVGGKTVVDTLRSELRSGRRFE